MNLHKPVLLDEALAGLAIKPTGTYLDCTFGRGGHSKAILGILENKGRLIAIDRDPEAVAAAQSDLGRDPRFCICRGTFGEITDIVRRQGMTGLMDGVLMDLGVSSPQLDDPARGFSFSSDGPLDMRMSPDEGTSAADWLAQAEEREISRVLFRYGEERQAKRIARAIVEARLDAPIRTTGRLAAIIEPLVPAHRRKRHPATKTLQAIRIFINPPPRPDRQARVGGDFVIQSSLLDIGYSLTCHRPSLATSQKFIEVWRFRLGCRPANLLAVARGWVAIQHS